MESTQDIRGALIEKVRIIASKYYRMTNCVDYDEYLDAGMRGLFAAIRRYDPARNCRLTNYAEHRIRGAIKDMLRQRARYLATNVSLDAIMETDDGSMFQTEVDADPVAVLQRAMDVNATMARLRRDLREILYLFYWRGYANCEIGQMMGVTGETASRKRKRALRWFRMYYVFG
jgi:RNA polymerase sigma factor (sigma-70 family)